jgi:uncharacterized protein with FMN-binding domain
MVKRSALIAGGCVVGVGGIFLITPPAIFNQSTGLSTPTALPTTSTATPKATSTKTATTPATTTGKSGTFSGSTVQTQFGPVQVQIVVKNGKITSASALQQPNRDFRSQSINQQAIPYLIQETLTAQSANIAGVGGASYTSGGWQQSLASALAKAGL